MPEEAHQQRSTDDATRQPHVVLIAVVLFIALIGAWFGGWVHVVRVDELRLGQGSFGPYNAQDYHGLYVTEGWGGPVSNSFATRLIWTPPTKLASYPHHRWYVYVGRTRF